MKVIAVLLLALAAASAGTLPNAKLVHPRDRTMAQSFESRIIGGSNASQGQFKYQAGIVFGNILSGWFCGASVIGTKYILTAAHCTNGALYGKIFLGNVTLQSGEEVTFTFSNINQHPLYNSNSLENDISIIKLDEPIEFGPNIGKIGLPSLTAPPDSYEGQIATVSGWGYTKNNGPSQPSVLQFTETTVISNFVCSGAYNISITDGIMCTSVLGGKATCSGDSGGALVINTGNTEPIQGGIVSFGSAAGCDQKPSGYTRVSFYRPWINSICGF